jgi:hypothetical protein
MQEAPLCCYLGFLLMSPVDLGLITNVTLMIKKLLLLA